MIRSSHWRVYDLVFSGVSLIKNYKAQFNSHIKRKGMDSLIKKINKKIKKPPGSDTLAFPYFVSIGPSTKIAARIVLTKL
jgi:hypothetical protein